MKFIKLIAVVSVVTMVSCGSSERVIMEDGTVYKIKNNKFYQSGENVSEQLTSDEKDAIKNTLSERLEAEHFAEQSQKELEEQQEELKQQQEGLEKEQKALEEALKEAKEKQKELKHSKKELKASKKELKEHIENKEKARKAVLKAEEQLASKKERYQKLKNKGKLSPIDEEKWEVKLANLQEELNNANEIYKNLK